jgi:hypothetical protein
LLIFKMDTIKYKKDKRETESHRLKSFIDQKR